MSMNIVLIGVGGQGILTIGDLLTRAALKADVSVSFAPTKGMAQRGGFVKAEMRLGESSIGPRVRNGGADLVIAMEQSEALKGLDYIKPDGTFLLYAHVWRPTGVQLGRDDYPCLEGVIDAIRATGATPIVVHPSDLPVLEDGPAAPNVFLLGTALVTSPLGEWIEPKLMEEIVAQRWPKKAASNVKTFVAGVSSS